jgi:beta-glucosidase
LKNDSVLPLKETETLAFIGEFAKKPRFQGGGSSHINSFRVSNVLDVVSENANITYAKGFPANADIYDEALAKEAVEAAKTADKVVIFAGLPDSFESEGYDRTHMRLPDCQNRLIDEILAVQPDTIIVLHNGSPVEMPWLSRVKGLLEAYLGGQAVGEAVADILYGKCCPCGKLAETIPYKLSDNPSYLSFGDGENVTYQEGIFVGYRYYDAKEMPVAFPFGYGLSYTSYAYSNLRIDKPEITENDTVTVSVDVTNTGDIEGKEIVQLYVRDLTGAARRPLRELKGYEKVSLKPGETKTVNFVLDYRSFAWYHTGIKDWYAASGDYRILIGASSRDLRLSEKVHLTTQKLLPLKVHMNTTLGDLLADERTAGYAADFKKQLEDIFGASSSQDKGDGDVAISDEMNNAMIASMPLRNVVSYGMCGKKELLDMIEEMNRL